ncbi:MAG TPA: hypothetical protein VMX15_01925 [Candidatus Heimdallarchaeota archaeon]|nr:hypothetical protein [Candidatus Heimdallarchaeota archaeon]
MRRLSWQFGFGASLVAVSLVLYLLHYLIFGNPQHIFLWSLTSLAFLPISVLFVTLLINRLMRDREKRLRMEKLNMVIGAFFSEVGIHLLVSFSNWDPNLEDIRRQLVVGSEWSDEDFDLCAKRLRRYSYQVDAKKAHLESLGTFLRSKRDFLLRLLENPNLLEHEAFTALLRAVFHLTEELDYRGEFGQLPEPDKEHLAGDMRRAYVMLVQRWLDYMEYMKKNYPFLFSLAVRTNPFDAEASPIVT